MIESKLQFSNQFVYSHSIEIKKNNKTKRVLSQNYLFGFLCSTQWNSKRKERN